MIEPKVREFINDLEVPKDVMVVTFVFRDLGNGKYDMDTSIKVTDFSILNVQHLITLFEEGIKVILEKLGFLSAPRTVDPGDPVG